MLACQKLCHGNYKCLECSSVAYRFSVFRKIFYGIRHKGFLWTLRIVLSKTVKPARREALNNALSLKKQNYSPCEEVLDLRPGEIVEVKPEEEILATLDHNSKHHGLLWMRGMDKYCGKRYKVLKRIRTIRLEGNGKLRKMKNTVLLEDVICDGLEYYG